MLSGWGGVGLSPLLTVLLCRVRHPQNSNWGCAKMRCVSPCPAPETLPMAPGCWGVLQPWSAGAVLGCQGVPGCQGAPTAPWCWEVPGGGSQGARGTPGISPHPTSSPLQVLRYFDYVFTGVFTFEMVIKVRIFPSGKVHLPFQIYAHLLLGSWRKRVGA